MFEKNTPAEIEDLGPPKDRVSAFRVDFDIKFDLESGDIRITSFNLKGIDLRGRDLKALFERAPGEVAALFHRLYGVEVMVIPVHSVHRPTERRIEDGFVAVPIRPLAAALRDMEPRP